MDPSGDLIAKLMLHGVGVSLSLVVYFLVDKPWDMKKRPGSDEVFMHDKGVFGMPQINPYPIFLDKDGSLHVQGRLALIAWFMICFVLIPWIAL